jgi:hypothetical protein
VDIKTKNNPRWLGIYNERHHEHYVDIDAAYDCPVLVAMFLLSDDNEVEETFLINVADSGEVGFVDRRFKAPDGNTVVKIDEEFHRSWSEFQSIVS